MFKLEPKVVSLWGAIAVSVFALLTFSGALALAFCTKDSGLLSLTVGAAIANATSVVQFWIGSSSGSQKKDDTIAAAAKLGIGNGKPDQPIAIAVNNPSPDAPS